MLVLIHVQYADTLCIVALSVCCVTGTDNDTVTDIDTYTGTVDTDNEAACKLYFVTYYTYHALMIRI